VINLIVSSYTVLLDLVLIVLLLAGAVAAYHLVPDALFSRDFYEIRNVLKVLMGLGGTFVLEVLLVGPFLLLADIRLAVRRINSQLAERATGRLGTE